MPVYIDQQRRYEIEDRDHRHKPKLLHVTAAKNKEGQLMTNAPGKKIRMISKDGPGIIIGIKPVDNYRCRYDEIRNNDILHLFRKIAPVFELLRQVLE